MNILTISTYRTSDDFPNSSEFQFPHLQNRENANYFYFYNYPEVKMLVQNLVQKL